MTAPLTKNEIDVDSLTLTELREIARDELWRRARVREAKKRGQSQETRDKIAASVKRYHEERRRRRAGDS